MNNTKLASSGTLEGIINLISEYFYSPNIKLTYLNNNKWSVENKNGVLDYHVVLKKRRYIFMEGL